MCTIDFRNGYDITGEILCSQFSLRLTFNECQVVKTTSLFKIVAFKNVFMKRITINLYVWSDRKDFNVWYTYEYEYDVGSENIKSCNSHVISHVIRHKTSIFWPTKSVLMLSHVQTFKILTCSNIYNSYKRLFPI